MTRLSEMLPVLYARSQIAHAHGHHATYGSETGGCELLGSVLLRLHAEVLDFGLTENDVGVRARRFEDVGLGDNEKDLPNKSNGPIQELLI